PPSGPTASGCDMMIQAQQGAAGRNEDWEADSVEIISGATCSEWHAVDVFASVTGAPRLLGEYAVGAGESNYAIFAVDPCSLAGGADLPGTKVTVKAATEPELASVSSVITLGLDTL